MTPTLLDSLPLPVFFLLTGIFFLLVYEGGFRLGRQQRVQFEDGKRSQASVIVGSLIALTAFFTAFTFNSTYSRFEARKQLVIQEANVIGTAYLRAQLMPDPHRSQILAQLQAYVEQRLIGATQGQTGDIKALTEAINQSEITLDNIWQQVIDLSKITDLDSVNRGLFTEAINEVFDTHTTRITVAVYARLPTIIWLSVGFTALLSIAVLGYHGGLAGLRSIFVTSAMILSLAFVFVLITSLDRPGASFFDVNQKAMQDLKATMSKK